jgi:hypothetical protein
MAIEGNRRVDPAGSAKRQQLVETAIELFA